MATYNTVIKKRNTANNAWDSILPITTAENVLINEQGDTVASRLAETMQLKFSELSSITTNMDIKGIYINSEWKRKDNTIYAKSTLLGTTPNYNQIKIDYYDNAGIKIIKSITWSLSYDNGNFIYKKDVI